MRNSFWIGLAALVGCVPGEVDGGTGEACGSRGLPSCEVGEFCSFPESAACGEADAPGVCTEQPGACTKEYAPVCGCDGITYGNACMAASEGVSVREQGECETGKLCGGIAGIPCPDDQYCNFAPSAQCGAGDQAGTCRPKPDACTLQYDPVCGCDDKTYGNACAAASAGVSILHDGEC